MKLADFGVQVMITCNQIFLFGTQDELLAIYDCAVVPV